VRIKRLTEDNPVARALAWLAAMIFRHRRLCVISQVVLFVASILITVKYPGLKFDMRQDNLVGANKEYHQDFLHFKNEFPTQDDLAVVVESENPEKNRQFVERLGAKMEGETNLFHNTFYKGDLKMLGTKALLFVPEKDLKEMGKMLEGYRPFISRFTHTTNLVSLFDMVNTQFRTAKQEQSAENDSLVKALPALERIIHEATYSLQRSGTPPSPGVTALFDPGKDAEQQIYITFNNGLIYLLTTQAPTEDLNEAAVTRMRELIEQTKAEVPGVNVGLTGEPVLDIDQMNQSQKDATAASIISLIICAFIFIYGYQETGRPIKATISLVVGLAYTLAFSTLTVGHLNILTVTFVPILIGLAIDYGVHLISRYEEELRHGKAEEAALTKAMVYTGQGIFTGAFTTAGAFLAMMFTNFKGIQEMGVICGGGLLICFIPMMTLLPVLLLKGRRKVFDHEAVYAEEARRARIENIWLKRPALVGGLMFALCAVAATQVHKVFFDYNLLNLQSNGLPAVQFFEKLIAATNTVAKVEGTNTVAQLGTTNLVAKTEGTNSVAAGEASNKSLLYAAVIATNLQEAALLEAQLTNLPAVAGVESMTRFLTEDQEQKLVLVGNIKQSLCNVRFAEADRQPVDLTELSFTLYRFNGYLEFASGMLRQEDPELVKQFDALHDAVAELRKAMLHGELGTNAVKLAAFQQALFDDVRTTFQALQEQDNRAPLRVQDLPESLHNRFVGVTGKYLLMVYPKKDVWDRANQKEFIDQIQPIYPHVTGTPVQLFHYTELLKASYMQAGEYALIAIALLVLVHFRSLGAVVLALIPVGIGSLWLGGLMGFFHVPLNPANIMTLPLLIGIGVTNGIHILNRFAEEQTPSILARSTGKAVLVSGLTTIAGFGSLALGQHRGLQSLGYVMSTGLATCMIAALTFLPALLNLFSRGKPPAQGQKASQEQRLPVEAAN
jgi:uncharacterized protein